MMKTNLTKFLLTSASALFLLTLPAIAGLEDEEDSNAPKIATAPPSSPGAPETRPSSPVVPTVQTGLAGLADLDALIGECEGESAQIVAKRLAQAEQLAAEGATRRALETEADRTIFRAYDEERAAREAITRLAQEEKLVAINASLSVLKSATGQTKRQDLDEEKAARQAIYEQFEQERELARTSPSLEKFLKDVNVSSEQEALKALPAIYRTDFLEALSLFDGDYGKYDFVRKALAIDPTLYKSLTTAVKDFVNSEYRKYSGCDTIYGIRRQLDILSAPLFLVLSHHQQQDWTRLTGNVAKKAALFNIWSLSLAVRSLQHSTSETLESYQNLIADLEAEYKRSAAKEEDDRARDRYSTTPSSNWHKRLETVSQIPADRIQSVVRAAREIASSFSYDRDSLWFHSIVSLLSRSSLTPQDRETLKDLSRWLPADKAAGSKANYDILWEVATHLQDPKKKEDFTKQVRGLIDSYTSCVSDKQQALKNLLGKK